MAKIEWALEARSGGLRLEVGSVGGVQKYFIARDDEAAQRAGRKEGLWRVGLADRTFAVNPSGETKWFARIGSAKQWAERQES